jgi:hypothetical protein
MITHPKNDFERMFGPYPEGHCFEIESSSILKKINDKAKQGEGVKIAEFLLLSTANGKASISIIEAKASAPQNDDQYINDVQEKLSNSLSLFIAIYLQRHSKNNSELSDFFKQTELSNVSFILILAIQNCEKSRLPPMQDKLKTALKKTARIWNIDLNSVIVLNEAGAKRHGLITSTTAQ